MNGYLAVGVGYLLGSISFSILIVKLTAGRDVREVGSGNAGATNVLRAAGKAAAILTLLGDVAKGAAAVLLARWIVDSSLWVAAAGAAAVVGHMFPAYFGFRGGKGVATAAGVFLLLAPGPTLLMIPFFALVVLVTRLVSLGSILTSALLPISCWVFHSPARSLLEGRFRPAVETVWAAILVAVLVVLKHRTNLERLVRGEERRLGEKADR